MNSTESSAPPLLVAGTGPVPPENPERLSAPGLRVWGVARELARRGHAVRLATVRFTGAPLDRIYVWDFAGDAEAVRRQVEAGAREVEVGRAEWGPGSIAETLKRLAEEANARAVVGVCELMCRHLARAGIDAPAWFDFFGDPMAERQMLAALHGSDRILAEQWATLAETLARGDRFSGCSRHQVGAILGELAAVGRLNRHTARGMLAERMAPWVEELEIEAADEAVARGAGVPAEARLIIQTGGFNTWLDVDNLFKALERVLAARPDAHFAASGGALAGHDDQSFRRFEELVQGSANRERYHLLGWLSLAQVKRLMQEADLALNVDRACAEGWLGTRNRLLDWVRAGLPAVTTIGCELAEELAARGAVRGTAQGDAAAVAEEVLCALEAMDREPERMKREAAEAAQWVGEEYAAERCLGPLLEWARAPKRAADLEAWAGDEKAPELWRRAVEEGEPTARIEELEAELEAARRREAQIKGSRWVKLALGMRRLTGGE